MLFGAMAAFAIAKLRWKLSKLTMFYFLIGIIVPYITFSLPITIYIMVGFFEGIPNELLLAMVFLSDEAKKTLPVSLTKFVGTYHTNYCQMFAAIMIAIVLTIIAYVAFANQIVEGLTAGAVKG